TSGSTPAISAAVMGVVVAVTDAVAQAANRGLEVALPCIMEHIHSAAKLALDPMAATTRLAHEPTAIQAQPWAAIARRVQLNTTQIAAQLALESSSLGL